MKDFLKEASRREEKTAPRLPSKSSGRNSAPNAFRFSPSAAPLGEATGKPTLLLLGLSLLLAATAVFSFVFYQPSEEGGELYAAAIALKDTLKENEAVAVFLGLSEEAISPNTRPTPEEEQAARIRDRAAEYILLHNAKAHDEEAP